MRFGESLSVLHKASVAKFRRSPLLFSSTQRTFQIIEKILKFRHTMGSKKNAVSPQAIQGKRKVHTIAIEVTPLFAENSFQGISKYVGFIAQNLTQYAGNFEFIFFKLGKNQEILIGEFWDQMDCRFLSNSRGYENIEIFYEDKKFDAILWSSPFEESINSLQPLPVNIFAIVYDLIPLFRPFDFHSRKSRQKYLKKIKELDRVVVFPISMHTKNELAKFNVGFEVTNPLGVGKLNEKKNQTFGDLQEKFFLLHGGEHPRKNLDFVVKNWRDSSFSREFHLKVIGSVSLETIQRIRSIAKGSSKDITFLGYISDSDLVDLYVAAALVICPSLDEGLGLPAIDAMLLSKRAIFSNIPSHIEFIHNHRIFFDPRSGSDFIYAIKNELKRDIESMPKPNISIDDWTNGVTIMLDSFRRKMSSEE